MRQAVLVFRRRCRDAQKPFARPLAIARAARFSLASKRRRSRRQAQNMPELPSCSLRLVGKAARSPPEQSCGTIRRAGGLAIRRKSSRPRRPARHVLSSRHGRDCEISRHMRYSLPGRPGVPETTFGESTSRCASPAGGKSHRYGKSSLRNHPAESRPKSRFAEAGALLPSKEALPRRDMNRDPMGARALCSIPIVW